MSAIKRIAVVSGRLPAAFTAVAATALVLCITAFGCGWTAVGVKAATSALIFSAAAMLSSSDQARTYRSGVSTTNMKR
jgi:hypothetical protein